MHRRFATGLSALLVCVACAAQPTKWDWSKYEAPDWRKYQARDVGAADDGPSATLGTPTDRSRFTFGNLKSESDQSLAERLLGAVGKRIAYIDRQKHRWQYYQRDDQAAEAIDLYTHPDALGSQYGVCGVERYSVSFDDAGHPSTVSVTQRYGIEGPIFQKQDFDWDHYYDIMCASVPASHAPSYYPAADSSMAQDVAMLLVPVIDLANSAGPLPYQLNCRSVDDRPCDAHIRDYLGKLRLDEIDELSSANCPLPGGPKAVCFTITTGEHRLGPFPKSITVKGSTHMNNVRVDSVEVQEGFTVS